MMPEYDGRSLARILHDTVVFEELCSHGPLTRAEIADRCGITKITVLEITERLLKLDLIERIGKKADGRPGPKATLYAARGTQAFGIGVELHRHSVSVEVEDLAGKTLAVYVGNNGTDEVGPAALRHAVLEACKQAGVVPADCAATVIASSGGVHRESGRLLSWENPHWKRNVQEGLATALGGRIELQNEVNLRAIAEHAMGCCQKEQDFVYLALGTGVAAGIVRDGQIVVGRNGLAGELGYAVMSSSISGGADIETVMRLRDFLGGAGIMEISRRNGSGHSEPLAAITEAFARPLDSAHAPFIDEYAGRVAVAVAMLLAVLDPAAIVLGGDFGLLGGELLATMVSERLDEMYSPLLVPLPPVLVSEVAVSPVRVGAMVTVRRRLRTSVLEAAGYPVDGRTESTKN